MLNYETILSNYDDKLTLMQWLKKVEAALENASATAFHVNKRGNATLTFSIDFADGSQLESEPIILQQGESVASGRISNGHLILTLTNGDEIDAGVILDGNVNALNVTGALTAGSLSVSGNAAVDGSIEQKTANYSTAFNLSSGRTITNIYNRFVVINGVLHIVMSVSITNNGEAWTPSEFAYGAPYINPTYGEKIIDVEGRNVHEGATTENATITDALLVGRKGITSSSSIIKGIVNVANRTSADTMRIALINNENVTIAAGETIYITARVALTLL